MALTVFHYIALGAVVLLGALLFVVLFEPGLSYEINAELPPTDTHEFLGLVAALVDAAALGRSRIDVLTNDLRVA
jgi:cardiolipin synthase